MPKTLEEIIADRTAYADDMELTIGTEKVALGALRGLSAKQQDALQAEMVKATKAREQADAKFAEAMNLSTRAAELYTKLNSAPPSPSGPSNDPYDTDPFYAPVRERLKAADERYGKAVKDLQDTTKKFETMLTNASVSWYKREAKRELDAYPHKDAAWYPKDKSLDDLISYAGQRHLLDEDGLPSVRRALDDMTREARDKAEAQAKYEEGVKAGEQRQMAAQLQRPTLGVVPPPSKDAPTSFEQVKARVYSDPDLVRQVDNFLTTGRV